METTEIMSALVDIHNSLAEISVRGDDAIRMADVIKKCRGIVFTMQKELTAKDDDGSKEADTE